MSVREGEVTSVFRLAMSGRSVEVVGARQAGKSWFCDRLAELFAQAGLTVLRLRGGGDQLPLEALRLALPPMRQGSLQVAISARILEAGAGAIIIDDVDRLDAASWSAVSIAAATGGIPIVASRSTAPLTGRMHGGSWAGARITLDDLIVNDVHDMLQKRLGGIIAPSFSSRVHTKSAGRIGVAVAIIEGAVAAGLAHLHDGVWTDAPDLWTAALDPVYEGLLAPIAPEAADALEILAMIGPSDLCTVSELIGQEQIEHLEGLDLVRILSMDGRVVVALNPPGLSDYFLHRPTSSRRLRLQQTIESTLNRSEIESRPFPALDVAFSQQLKDVPTVSYVSVSRYKTETAAALYEWTQSEQAAAAIRLLSLQFSGNPDSDLVCGVFENLSFDHVSATEELVLRYLRGRWQLGRGASRETVIDTMNEAMDATFEYAASVRALELAVDLEMTGIEEGALRELRSLCSRRGLNGEVARLVLTYAYILAGESVKAMELLSRAPIEIIDPFATQFDIARGLALYGCGRYQEAADWAQAQVARCMSEADRLSLAGHAYVAVVSLAGLGRFEDALIVSQVVLGAGVRGGNLLFSPDRALLYVLGFVAIRTGRPSAARALIERAGRIAGRSDGLPYGTAAFTEAAAVSSAGNASAAASEYRALAQRLAERGYRLAADSTIVLELMAKFDPDLARDFEPRARLVAGEFFSAYLKGKIAEHSGVADDVVRAAKMMEQYGAADLAVRFLAFAVHAYTEEGLTASAAQAQRRIRELLTAGVQDGVAATALLGLTLREMEILRYLGQGLSNADIADALKVSVRTIDSHLRNVRRKTGRLTRGELIELVRALPDDEVA